MTLRHFAPFGCLAQVIGPNVSLLTGVNFRKPSPEDSSQRKPESDERPQKKKRRTKQPRERVGRPPRRSARRGGIRCNPQAARATKRSAFREYGGTQQKVMSRCGVTKGVSAGVCAPVACAG